ncbi:MAG: FMN-binding protein [Candidatus Omnitrophota bacterium]|nr:FMN-binding protein [Candidatus Omnitrophota bacterium]
MKSALRVIIFVLIMGTVSGGLLVGVNSFTEPLVLMNEELKLKSSVLDVLGIPCEKSETIAIFDSRVKALVKDKYTFYIASDQSVAFEFHGPGLWGPISGIVCLEKDLKTIRNIKITHQEETPGLGGRIAERSYLKQFNGKLIFPKLIFMPEGRAAGANEVDAITGATGSSRAFEKLINENAQKYLSALKER